MFSKSYLISKVSKFQERFITGVFILKFKRFVILRLNHTVAAFMFAVFVMMITQDLLSLFKNKGSTIGSPYTSKVDFVWSSVVSAIG